MDVALEQSPAGARRLIDELVEMQLAYLESILVRGCLPADRSFDLDDRFLAPDFMASKWFGEVLRDLLRPLRDQVQKGIEV